MRGLGVVTDRMTAHPGRERRSPMLDAYLIDAIHREQQEGQDRRVQLEIEPPPPLDPPAVEREQRRDREERGIAEIDFRV
jgi:hypothetical protein